MDAPITRVHYAAATAIMFFAAAVRLHNLDHASLWLDEMLQAHRTSGPLGEIWQHATINKPLLDYYIQAAFIRLGAWEGFTRLHAALFGIAAVAAWGLFAARLGGPFAGLLMAGLMAGNPLMIRYAQEGPPYALMILALGLLGLAVARFLEGDRWRRPTEWLWPAVALVLCLWSLYFVLVPIAVSALVLGGVVIWRRVMSARSPRPSDEAPADRRWIRGALAAAAIVAIACVPLIIRSTRLSEESFHAGWDGFPLWRAIQWIDITAMGYDWFDHIAGSRWWLAALVLAAAVGVVLHGPVRKQALVCAAIAAITFAVMLAFYRIINHWLEIRYFLLVVPILLLAIALGLGGLAGSRRWLGWVAATLVVAYSIIGAFRVVAWPIQKTDWRAAASIALEYRSPTTVVRAADHLDAFCVSFYLRRGGWEAPAQPVDWSVDRVNAFRANPGPVIVIARTNANDQFLDSLPGFKPLATGLARVRIHARVPESGAPSGS